MKPKHFSHSVPFLPVKDIKETIQFYKDKLGFYNEWYWEDTDAGMERDDLHLLFNKNPQHTSVINTDQQSLEVCWFVNNVDEVYEEYKTNGINIVSPLEDKPWQMREFSIRDNNGYIIRIGTGISLLSSL